MRGLSVGRYSACKSEFSMWGNCMEHKEQQNIDKEGRGNGNDDHGHDRNDDRGREVKPPRPHGTPLNGWCS